MTRLLLVRHGETMWNNTRRLQGQEDIPLSETGLEQARALAPYVQAFAPTRVVASDLQRAQQTTRALGFDHYDCDPRLREAHLGTWVGLNSHDLMASDAAQYQGWREGTFTPPDGESFEQLCTRVQEALLEQLAEPGTALIVVHGGVIRAALARLLNLYPDRIVPVSPASLTIIDVTSTDGTVDARLHSFNITGYRTLEPAPD